MGRPPRAIKRHYFYPAIGSPLRRAVAAQAERVGMSPSTYLELLLSEAHEYHAPHLPHDVRLPIDVPIDELRERTARLTATEIRERGAIDEGTPDLKRVGVYGDQPLARRIKSRCSELSVSYADYLRAVFAMAAAAPQQPALFDEREAMAS